MDKNTAAQIDISAILNTYVYMDDQADKYYNKDLNWILKNMSTKAKASAEYQTILNAVKENPELGKLKLVSQSACEGYSDRHIIACAFKDESNGNVYVAYRGTGDGKWVDNGVGIARESSLMQEKSLEYFDSVVEGLGLDKELEGKLIVTGHSKGGNEAQYVTLRSEYGYLIDNCYSIDGQGFSQEAIDKFIELYGEDYYNAQLEKMYSINGENDYVHDLGIVVIPEKNTYFIKTSEADSIGGYHDINYMIEGAGLDWFIEDGEIVKGEQGDIGKLAKAMSEKMKYLDQEDLEDCAVTIMTALELFMPYNDETGGKYKYGTGDVKHATFEECIGFIANGLPMLAETLFLTEEGRAVVVDLVKGAINSIYEKTGFFGVVAATFVTSLVLPWALIKLGKIIIYAKIIEAFYDFVDDLKELYEKLKKWFADLKEAFVKIVNAAVKKLKSLTAGGRYANSNPQIVVDTYKLNSYASRLNAVNRRLQSLDGRLDDLYWKVGLLDLWNLIHSDFKICWSYSLNRCSDYLKETASDFINVENDLIKNLQ